ncbi:MAG: sugar transferase [Spartobacteria bacterium]|nr:sugar transferase [Spartobacteria bacterium]
MYFGSGHRISTQRIVLLVADIICIAGSMFAAAMIRLSIPGGWVYIQQHLPSLLGSFGIFLLVFYAGGMYERQLITRKEGSFQLPLIVVTISLVIIVVLFYARFRLHIGRGILASAAIMILFGSWFSRRVLRVALGYGVFSQNTLVLGTGSEAMDVLDLLKKEEQSGYRLFGVVGATGERSGDFLKGIPVLGHIDQLRDFVAAYSIENIIVATSLSEEHSLLQALRPLRYSGIEIMDYVALHEELAQEIPIDHIDDEWLMNAAMNSSRIHIRQIKRIMDIAVSVVGLLLLSVISLLAAISVKFSSKGPVLYRQVRSGLDGRAYTLWKLRTMTADAEAATGAVWSGANDHRVTGVGRFLRKWRIDEIPQLVNVLRGEMSLVGPRPERPEFVEQLSEMIPYYKERLLVPPGITGWAQVKFPYVAGIEGSLRKLQYDLYYIKNMSLALDVLILIRTFKTIIVGLKYDEGVQVHEY